MYLLPITTYFDYWRATRTWGTYLGGLAVFTVGTHYSALSVSKNTNAASRSEQVMTQSSTLRELPLEAGFSEFRQKLLNQSTQGAFDLGTVSRGLPDQDMAGRGLLSQGVKADQDGGGSAQEAGRSEGLEADQVVKTDQNTSTVVTNIITIEDKDIPYETQYIESEELPPGQTEIQTVGEKGIYRRVVKTFVMAGKPIDQQVQSSYELISPKKEVILRNSKPVPKKKVIIQKENSIGEDTNDLNKLNIRKTLNVEATAYTYTGNKTATGVEPQEGMIAVDPKVIALGSKVYVEGYGYAIAADTGGDIRGNRIDVFFTSLRKCINWGRRPARIYVLNAN